ncbi:orotate phosphoribosyltransferase-like protein [Halolamina pelagica]|uniref:Orotate phosphoribosyltransferase-like protein n=1 Tax=Halolamina pelagica TaxID=699431 RepID=A0A0N8HZX3_9EURY|nr:orotate phosphoribosyltransferase-like protein [Halolamina pelagica]
MKNVDDLIEDARSLADRGFSKGEIADELNVSRQTASWLVERAGATPVQSGAPATSTSTGRRSAVTQPDWATSPRRSRTCSRSGARTWT